MANGFIVRGLWGDQSIPCWDTALVESAKTVRADTWELERGGTRVYCYGLHNANHLSTLGLQWVCLGPEPVVNWLGLPERNQSEDGRVNWGLSHWRHKLEVIRAGLMQSEAVVWLDWDCRQIEPLPADFWHRMAEGPPFRASLRQYRKIQVTGRHRQGKRQVPHGAWMYFRRDWIQGIIDAHATYCPDGTDEQAAAYFLDDLHGRWIGVHRWRELYEPTCYDQRVTYRQVVPCTGPVQFLNMGRY